MTLEGIKVDPRGDQSWTWVASKLILEGVKVDPHRHQRRGFMGAALIPYRSEMEPKRIMAEAQLINFPRLFQIEPEKPCEGWT